MILKTPVKGFARFACGETTARDEAVMFEWLRATKWLLFILIGTSVLLATGQRSFADETLREWIGRTLGKFGSVVAEPKMQQNNTLIYYFQMKTVNFASTSYAMLITITCGELKAEDPAPVPPRRAFCNTGTVTGGPPDFPPAFISPVYP
jgi:hypothetical protein